MSSPVPTSTTLPGDLGLPTLSNLYVQGMPLDALNQALGQNAQALPTQHATSEQSFFSTPARTSDDPTREVFQVAMSSAQRVNRISFALAHFPQRAWLEYLDPTDGTWQVATQTNGLAAEVTIQDSIPAIIPSGVQDNSHLHPQHFGAAHWEAHTFDLTPLTVSKVRIVMTRLTTESVPLSMLGDAVTYSLGLKDFWIGYSTAPMSSVPIVQQGGESPTESVAIATGTDVLGSQTQYVIRKNAASGLGQGTGAIWKCAPQPIADAVVNLYVDCRDQDGDEQVIDRFWMDPLYSGCTVNIYFSRDTPNPVVFTASDQPLSFPVTTPNGAVPPVSDGSGILFGTTPAWLDLNNSAISFDPTQPFQVSALIQPQFGYTDTNSYTFYDDGVLTFFWGPDPSNSSPYSCIQVRLGSMLLSWPGLPFSVNQQLVFTVTYDGTSLMLAGPMGTIQAVSGGILPGTNPPTTLRIGGAQGATPGVGNFRLRDLIFKQGNPDTPDVYQQFWADPSGFVLTPEYPTGPQLSDNAVLRYDPAQVTAGLNPYGFVGGPGVVYEDLNWTPVPRDFKLSKGYFTFDPVTARYAKLEFTNLCAQPYDTAEPMLAFTKQFAIQAKNVSHVAKAAASSAPAGSSGIAVNTSVAAVNRFSDQARLASSGVNAVSPTRTSPWLPTEAQYATDPQAADRLDQQLPYWGFQKHQQGPTMPRNEGVGQHYYVNTEIPFRKRVAYFVGLKDLRLFRLDKQSADDTDQYIELFHDANDLVYNPNAPTWFLGDGQITTPDNMVAPVQLLSQPYNTFRGITALQFATTQSPAVQLLTDPDFNDLSLQWWQAFGDASIVPDPVFDTQIGSLVKVTRAGNPVTWSSMEAYGTWNQIEDSNPVPNHPTWDDLQGTIAATGAGGIQSFQTVQPSAIGKLYAAARVIAPADLTAPLTLQLVNGDGTILASIDQEVDANAVTEWFVEYDLGAGVNQISMTWSAMEGMAANWSGLETFGTWDQVANAPASIALHNVSVELIQNQPTADVWYVDNISIFNDALMWEFSRDGGHTFWPVWDIKNDPDGVFVFPLGVDSAVLGQGSRLVFRVTGALPGLWVSSIAMRPWFESIMYGQQVKYSVMASGPHLTPLDQYPLVTDDARFKQWHHPIPQDWWYAFRQSLHQTAITPTVSERIFVPNSIPSGLDEGAPPAPSNAILPESYVI